jgi:predicted metal-binding membrane protein
MTAPIDAALEAALRRDRLVVISALILIIALSWTYLLSGAGMSMSAFEMTRMSQLWLAGNMSKPDMADMTMTAPAVWTFRYALSMFLMWWVMMLAMMLPGAAPIILLTAALNRRSCSEQPPYGAVMFFTSGYLLAWLLFSLLAVIAQLVLETSGLLSSMMYSISTHLTAGLLLGAGLWQFSSIKQACLRHCRSPVDFLTRHRRSGNRGALVMGLHHGTYCLGCCWFLMALLFVGGVMNLYWIAGFALFVIVEKLFPKGLYFGRVAGAGFVTAGTALLML